jgi:hypothetical protein
MEVIGVIIAGIVVSLLGKWWLGPHGRDDLGMVTTAVCGVGGVLVGWYAAAELGITMGHGEAARWAVALLVGSAFAAIMAMLTGRSLASRL